MEMISLIVMIVALIAVMSIDALQKRKEYFAKNFPKK